jgi:Sulfotransferase family
MSANHRPERVLYFAGTSFTGSTLAAFMLNLHPQIVSVGEATGPARKARVKGAEYPCSCGEKLAECPFWTSVGQEMAARGEAFDLEDWGMRFDPDNRLARRLLTSSLRSNRADDLREALILRTPGLGTSLRATARRNEAVMASVCSVADKPVFADASKQVFRVRCLDHLTDLRPYVVHLVRDSLGFVASKKSRRERNPKGAELGDAIGYWNRRAAQTERLFATLPPERRLRVRYEDLCEDPEREFGRICGLLGLEPLPGPYDLLASDHHIIGNRMRLASSSEVVLDERWRSILSSHEIDVVRRKTNGFRERFGYA